MLAIKMIIMIECYILFTKEKNLNATKMMNVELSFNKCKSRWKSMEVLGETTFYFYF